MRGFNRFKDRGEFTVIIVADNHEGMVPYSNPCTKRAQGCSLIITCSNDSSHARPLIMPLIHICWCSVMTDFDFRIRKKATLLTVTGSLQCGEVTTIWKYGFF